MKEFDVKITETLEKVVTVQAESQQEAEQKVSDAWKESEYILGAEDFVGAEFTTQDEREIKQKQTNTIDVLLIQPCKYPQKVQIGTELEDLQAIVGGNIEVIYPFRDAVGLVLNEEGKLMGLELNRALRDESGNIYDIMAGDFLVVGLTEESFCSLTPEQLEKFEEKFHQPEMFIRMGKQIMALPLPDNRVKDSKTIKPERIVPPNSQDRDVR